MPVGLLAAAVLQSCPGCLAVPQEHAKAARDVNHNAAVLHGWRVALEHMYDDSRRPSQPAANPGDLGVTLGTRKHIYVKLRAWLGVSPLRFQLTATPLTQCSFCMIESSIIIQQRLLGQAEPRKPYVLKCMDLQYFAFSGNAVGGQSAALVIVCSALKA
ncbi:MAG: hypothetical protein FRX49_11210 [Trebouxia sp. A1-2]|nr:MAG: hypothetical protein FRX49_11210 [Trebouxia sp. A1-2]